MASLPETLSLIQQELIRYTCSAYLFFGIVGSCLNIILLTQRQYRTVSCCIYFVVISALALIIIFMGVIPFLYSLHHNDPTLTNTIFCKIRSYILQSNLMMFRWCLAAACLDRYALTLENGRLRGFATVRVAYRVIAVFIVIWLITSVYIPIFYYSNGIKCYALGNTAVALYQNIYTIITGNILPVTIMTVCAVLIRRNLVRKYQRRRQMVFYVHSNNMQSERRYIQHIFPMLLLQVFIYVITQTPWMLYNIYSTATIYVTNKSADRIAIEQFLWFLSQMTIYLITVLPFYLYTLTSHEYRHKLMKLLHFCFEFKRPNRIHP